MSNLIIVIGAAGGWKVRGTTRNTSSENAKGIEVVSANLNDEESLKKAFHETTAIFAFTDYYDTFFELGNDKSLELEFE
ncbi:hypothetical protein CSAL01_04023 [Colletotrichum salicis]|uniref:NmrA-like domain-containing protein n=1 Tax=Colletotrichum salicis TaxID=1209931 RepID=A0A135U0L5_9PEZI|nr:hypothetical protein CSAL01_04023 [Colletotrichum salicis]